LSWDSVSGSDPFNCAWWKFEALKNDYFKNNCLAEMRSGSEEGSYVRLIDSCIIEL